MRILAIGLATLALAACQHGLDSEPIASSSPEAVESDDDDDDEKLAVHTGRLIGAANIGEIAGEWVPYSRAADTEFGGLKIDAEQLSLAAIGTATMRLEPSHVLLDWDEDYEGLIGICGAKPPAAIEFRLSDKDDYLAPGTKGQVLELSFYSSAQNISVDRDTNLDLCRTGTWDRE